ncbi:unnamed protein product, partial [marine sediment metagenome]
MKQEYKNSKLNKVIDILMKQYAHVRDESRMLNVQTMSSLTLFISTIILGFWYAIQQPLFYIVLPFFIAIFSLFIIVLRRTLIRYEIYLEEIEKEINKNMGQEILTFES